MTKIRLNQPTIRQIIKDREFVIVKAALNSLEGSIEGNQENISPKVYHGVLDLSRQAFNRYKDIFLIFKLAEEEIQVKVEDRLKENPSEKREKAKESVFKEEIELHPQIIFYVADMQDHMTIKNNLNRIKQLLALYAETMPPHIYKYMLDTIRIAERRFNNIDQIILLYQERSHYNNVKKLTY